MKDLHTETYQIVHEQSIHPPNLYLERESYRHAEHQAAVTDRQARLPATSGHLGAAGRGAVTVRKRRVSDGDNDTQHRCPEPSRPARSTAMRSGRSAGIADRPRTRRPRQLDRMGTARWLAPSGVLSAERGAFTGWATCSDTDGYRITPRALARSPASPVLPAVRDRCESPVARLAKWAGWLRDRCRRDSYRGAL